MENALINIALAFLEGLGLIVSPCILPILPIILSGSLAGSKKRPLGIIVGFVLIFALFTFFSRKLVQVSGIDLNVVRHFAFGILILLGLIMISTTLTEKFNHLTRRLATVGSTSSRLNNPEGGFGSGILFGGLVALIWTPCAGPILAAIIVQTVIQKTTFSSFLVLLAFALGAIIPMLIIAIFGRVMMAKLGFLKRNLVLIRKILGVVIIASVALLAYNDVYSATPLSLTSTDTTTQTALTDGISDPYPAPAIDTSQPWINSPPLTLSSLKGKVVLIDFWTYSCINCVRTLPFIKGWYEKYHNKGLVIIGVHTPEFDFEKELANVQAAVTKYGIKYPVVLDSNYGTWQNYHNQYWPAQYLIDKNGNVVYQHFGEGGDDVIENNIRFLLGMKEPVLITPDGNDLSDAFHELTPETYLGYGRAGTFESPENTARDTAQNYTYPETLQKNAWALKGKWTVAEHYILSSSDNAALKIKFYAKKVYIVMGAQNKGMAVKLLLDGQPITSDEGKDVTNSTVRVNGHALYEVLGFNGDKAGELEVIAPQGLEVYTFTFGG